ncbi:ABC transporter ATP-binding protein [Xanthomonas sp. LMG 8992]|uniref:ABC transporter ATP-binding protein n=1 Tax=Xanthomonas sp. LMG 8992 TaxID=1591157 RepID=UPI00136AA06D|nr:ABC transporter ATP-binding protein [Xanthomonas sp. LMG 8992]MXV11206.1 ABC transporter ATP-binding protein [Xanthomonas sp. LMG 8992]
MSNWRALRRLLGWAPRGRLLGVFLLMVLAGASEGIGVLLLVPLLGALQGGGATNGGAMVHAVGEIVGMLGLPRDAPLPLLALFCALVLLRNGIHYAREHTAARVQQDVAERLREASFTALLEAQWRWLVAQRSSDHASLMLTEVERIGVGLGHALLMLASLATAVVYLLAALALAGTLALATVVAGALLLLLLLGRRRRVLRLGSALTQTRQRLHAGMHDSLAGLRLAKILGAEARYRAVVNRDATAVRDLQVGFASGLALSKALLHSAAAVLLAGYALLGLQVWHLPLAELLILVVMFARLLPLLTVAQQQHQYWLHTVPAFVEVERQLAQAREWSEPALPPRASDWQVQTQIALRDVQVRYAGREAPALQQISLVLPARTTTAIVGPSGAGKSTLADVLCGLLGPDQGALEIDDVALDAHARRSWRHAVAYVSQDTFLFNDSIRNNLLLAAPHADAATLHLALEQAAAQFVHALPQGWDTVIGDRGMRLSGGERQRLALARALLQRPALLILDEATSALDHDNEARIRAAIERLHGDLTVVVIGHRLALLERADQVVVLEQGRVRAQGRWHEVAAAWTGAA